MKNIHILPTDKPSRLFYDISLDKLVLATTAETSKWSYPWSRSVITWRQGLS
jgi:hypothetical protein